MASNSHSKIWAWLLSFFGLLLACGDIPRDNPLDPKNPDSYCAQKIVIEAFVNTGNPYPYNQYMLVALDSLADLYPEQLVIAEYHRNTEQYLDSLHLNENELLYQHYLQVLGSSLKAVPDVFINGVEQHVQGASSVQSALFRLQQAVLSDFTKNSYFTMELSYQLHGTKIIPVVTLARLGREEATNILLKAIIIARQDELYHKRTVRGSTKSGLIPTLSPGDFKTIELPELEIDAVDPCSLIVYVVDKNERTIYQSDSLPVE